jgi:molecular chaperone GrpE
MSEAWEYAVMSRVYNGFEWRTGGSGVKLWKNRNLPMALDRAGADGWELVGFDTRKEATKYVFKRRLPAPGGGHEPGEHSVSASGSETGSGASAPGAGDEDDDTASQAIAEGSRRPGQAGIGRQPGTGGQASPLAARLAERTADVQRVEAEFANYRRRVERDRRAVREQELAKVLSELLPVLDDIGRAREHGELTGGFKLVAESLEAITVSLGLTSYGAIGDPFDPNLHEALMYSHSVDVSEPTCVQILQPGYKVEDRIIRPARVAVAGPEGAPRSAAAN